MIRVRDPVVTRIAVMLTLNAIVPVGCGGNSDSQPQAARMPLRPSRLLFGPDGRPLAEGDLVNAAYMLVPSTKPLADFLQGTWYKVDGGQVDQASGTAEVPERVVALLEERRAAMANLGKRVWCYDKTGALLEDADTVANGYMLVLEAGDAGSWGRIGRWYRMVDGEAKFLRTGVGTPKTVKTRWLEEPRQER